MRLVATALVGLSLLASAAASADSKHFDPTVTATRRGAKLKFGLRSDGYKTHARVVIGDPRSGSYGPHNYRDNSVKGPYAKHISEPVHVPSTLEHVIELDYDEMGLEAGKEYDLTTVWNSTSPGSKGAAAEHVWGMSRQGVTPVKFTAPERKPAASKAAKEASKD